MSVVAIQRPQRWDVPFGPDISDADVERILGQPPFVDIDSSRFPSGQSLGDIVRHDARLRRFRRGDILVRLGDYGSSVFVILGGTVRVLIDAEGEKLSGRRAARRSSALHALVQTWRNPSQPEVRDVRAYRPGAAVGVRRDEDAAGSRTYFEDVDELVSRFRTIQFGAGQMVGEFAALTRSPRTASIFADAEAEILELRWQGLREMRRRDPKFRAYLDGLYTRSFPKQLAEARLFRHLDAATLEQIGADIAFESYGDFEWAGSFKQAAARSSFGVIELEPLIAEEGHHLDGLILLRSGFARVSRRLDHGHHTVGYLTAGEVFGLEELVRQWRHGTPPVLRSSLRALGYVDILRIPTPFVEEHVLSRVHPSLLPATEDETETGAVAWSERPDELQQPLLDFLVDQRLINGTSAMVVDNDRCIECDECVVACALTHANNPRFVRHGPTHGPLTFASSCMHCVDPVCLIGCPTGAIHRNLADGIVLIDDATCIGCGTCATSCPYDNIRMVEIRDRNGAFILDAETRTPILKATKCDLGAGQAVAPACERACPHDALHRVDLRDRERLAEVVHKTAIGLRRRSHAAFAIAAGAIVAVLDVLWRQSLHDPQVFDGWLLAAAVAFLALLPVRKKLAALPLVPVSSYLQGHVYVGWLAVFVFLLHTGLRWPTGFFETLLWSIFVLVTATGILGLFLCRTLPSRLRRHGEKILFERIAGFRAELAAKAEGLAMQSARETGSATLAEYYASRLAGFFQGPRNVLAHLFESNRSRERFRTEFRHLERYLDPQGQRILDELAECVLAKDHLDYQYALQSALRGWRLVHLPLTVGLVLLALVHVVLVYAFTP